MQHFCNKYLKATKPTFYVFFRGVHPTMSNYEDLLLFTWAVPYLTLLLKITFDVACNYLKRMKHLYCNMCFIHWSVKCELMWIIFHSLKWRHDAVQLIPVVRGLWRLKIQDFALIWKEWIMRWLTCMETCDKEPLWWALMSITWISDQTQTLLILYKCLT